MYYFKFYSVEKKIDKIEFAYTFANRILDNGSDGEILILKQIVTNQLETLAEITNLKPKYTTNLEFITNLEKYRCVTKVT